MVESVTLDAKSIDVPYNISMIALWATIEVNLVTVSGTSHFYLPVRFDRSKCPAFSRCLISNT